MSPDRRRPRTPSPASRRRVAVLGLVLAALAVVAVAGALATDAFGVTDRLRSVARRIELILDPPPDRPIPSLVVVTPEPEDPTSPPEPTPPASLAPGETPTPAPTPTPVPQRVAVDVSLLRDPDSSFITELDKEWCAVAGSQMVMHIWGRADLSEAFQRTLAGRIGEWESRQDSRNGGWGPVAMVLALEAYGVPGYEVRAYETRTQALRDAARAISTYRAPVILLAWRGAHTWVMTGYRADADPTVFRNAKVTGAYVLDPWYPRVSSIWGRSDPPGTFQDEAEMKRNFLAWQRPEGAYPDRDGLFITVVPTQALDR